MRRLLTLFNAITHLHVRDKVLTEVNTDAKILANHGLNTPVTPDSRMHGNCSNYTKCRSVWIQPPVSIVNVNLSILSIAMQMMTTLALALEPSPPTMPNQYLPHLFRHSI